jgi:hypothetical protein
MVVHVCNPITGKAEAGRLQVLGQHVLHSEALYQKKEGRKEGKKEGMEERKKEEMEERVFNSFLYFVGLLEAMRKSKATKEIRKTKAIDNSQHWIITV